MTPQESLEQSVGKTLTKKKVFESETDFAAYHAAENFCGELGFSVGRMQREAPVGIKRGEWDIQKWRNMSHEDRKTLDGAIIGESKRDGPVTVLYCEEA